MNWLALWTTIKPIVIQIVTKILIPLLIGGAGGLATYHAACQPVGPAQPAGCDCGM
jgi:hypothetical protein